MNKQLIEFKIPSDFPRDEIQKQHECPHCKALCQFNLCGGTDRPCKVVRWKEFHLPYQCQNCHGMIISCYREPPTKVDTKGSPGKWHAFFPVSSTLVYRFSYPPTGGYKRKVDLEKITSTEVRDDFEEAINCYNNGSYNASMVMARRAIQQEVKGNEGDLYQQIESSGISDNLKKLLQKIKNFGNSGAHFDFYLFDNEGKRIEDKKKYAKSCLNFLDRYLLDQEIPSLIAASPKSKKELSK